MPESSPANTPLCIELPDLLREFRSQGRWAYIGNAFLISYAGFAFFYIVHLQWPGLSNSLWIAGGFICVLLGIFYWWRGIQTIAQTGRLCDGKNFTITVDAKGLEIPLLLVVEPLFSNLLRGGELSIFVPWSQVLTFKVQFPRPSLRSAAPPHKRSPKFVLKLQDATAEINKTHSSIGIRYGRARNFVSEQLR